MAELKLLQEFFSAAMSARDDRALPLIAGGEAEARKRLAIYRANIAANATGALAAIYPIVRTLVGAEFFAGLTQAYCAAHPSASGDLNELGAHLADFLPMFAPAQSLPYLPDVARLEWLDIERGVIGRVVRSMSPHWPASPRTITRDSRLRCIRRLACWVPPTRCFASGKCIRMTIAAISRSTWAAAVNMSSSTAHSFAQRSPGYRREKLFFLPPSRAAPGWGRRSQTR